MKTALLVLTLGAIQFASCANDDPFLWGPYRPNLYFGLRPRIPQSLMTGLMWFGTHDYQSIGHTRHSCEQSDNLRHYTWTDYDPREGGVQLLEDEYNNVKITTEFLKVAGGEHGGSWAARIKGEPLKPEQPSRISTIFYFGLEGLGGLEMGSEENVNGITGDFLVTGTSPELDNFDIRVVDGPKNQAVLTGPHSTAFRQRIGLTHFLGQSVPAGSIWKAKDHILQSLFTRTREVLASYQDPSVGLPDPSFVLQLPDEVSVGSNLFAVQKLFDGPFQFDVFFESASSKQNLTTSTLNVGIPALLGSLRENHSSALAIPDSLPTERRDGLLAFSRAITANLLGGVGYFHGNSIVDRKFAYEWDEDTNFEEDEDIPNSSSQQSTAKMTEPRSLLTATPSRSFFPRGFYWDEGFHLLHISQVNIDFGLEILKDWIGLIDENGWVAREQILGDEARSKVPTEFQTQVPNYANPPTLAMAVTAFIAQLKHAVGSLEATDLGMEYGAVPMRTIFLQDMPGLQESKYLNNPGLTMAYVKSIYAPLKQHYEWFRKTQRGQIKQYGRKARSRTEAYRWRGRSESHVLTSGMDDYPRGPPHAGELHLDLISWMAFFSRTMHGIAEFIGEVDDAISFKEIEHAILDNIDDLHWNEEQKMYCDLNVDDNDESYHICHKGYLSLFPFLLSILPATSPHLGSILDLIEDPKHLWSDYGLRSLSASHEEYGKGENYWKGPIWIQMNYLALQALNKKYMREPGPEQARAANIYRALRNNIIQNTYQEYCKTGYVWEQYDANNGEGKRSHPFTGWTSLIALVLAEKY